MIRSVLRLHAAPGRADDVARFYAENDVLGRAVQFGGCRDAVLLRAADAVADTFLVIADWDRSADYERWLADPGRAETSERLASLLETGPDHPPTGRLFAFVPAR